MGAKGPGPNYYCLPKTMGKGKLDVTLMKEPAYTFSHRPEEASLGLGPGLYDIGHLTRFGKTSTRGYTISKTDHLKQRDRGHPSPNKYMVKDTNIPRPPGAGSYTFGRRTCPKLVNQTPSPNFYVLPALKPTAGITTFPGREEPRRFPNPSPNAYNIPSNDKYFKRPPNVVLMQRTEIVDPRMKNPPPNIYNPKMIDRKIPIRLKEKCYGGRVTCGTKEDLKYR